VIEGWHIEGFPRALMAFRMRTTRAIVCLVAALISGSLFAADWNVTRYMDDKTGQKYSLASLAASDGGAWLHIRCANGRMFPKIVLARAMTPPNVLRLRTTFRFDTGAATTRMAAVAENGRELLPWLFEPETTVQRIARARLLLVEIFRTADDSVAFEFDVRGADRVVPQVRCQAF
jgi:hypothetical protein